MYIVLVEQPLFLDEDHTNPGCSATSSGEKVPIDKSSYQNYKWKRGDMVITTREYFQVIIRKNVSNT